MRDYQVLAQMALCCDDMALRAVLWDCSKRLLIASLREEGVRV